MEEQVIYEVLRVIDGKPLFLEKHLQRMNNSFEIINKKMPFTDDEIEQKLKQLIDNENKKEGNIKITYSINSKELKMFFIDHSYPSEDMYKNGVKTILYFGERNNPNAKIVNDDFRNKVNEKIRENNAYEAILVDRNGYITEGSRSNIFMIKGETVITSPLKAVLPGVTRSVILDLIKDNNIQFIEEEFSYKDIDKLDGMFISGTSPKVLPISKIGDIPINEKNIIVNKIMQKYNEKMDEYIKNINGKSKSKENM